MSANPTIEKVRRLIALTTSNHAEEARTSAFLACKIIREHGLHVVSDLPRVVPTPPAPTPRPATTRTPMARPRLIRSRFETHCTECALTIEVGEMCAWLKGRGCWDLECYREVWS